MTLRHIVSWKLAATDPEANRQHRAVITEALEGLPALIPEIRGFAVGSNVISSEFHHDLVLVADYENEDALQAYIAHPEHQRVVGIIGPLVATRAVVDFHA